MDDPHVNVGAMPPATDPPIDFSRSPLIVFYELARACDLICRHCRACAQPRPDPDELSMVQSKRLISQLHDFHRPPMLVLTGGDPFKRTDLFELIAHARSQGLDVSITPSATPLVTWDALKRLRDLKLHRLAVSLDGADPATHDAFRGVKGSHALTLCIMDMAQQLGIPLQVNTTLVRSNHRQIDAMADVLAMRKPIALWSVFFLVPVGRGMNQQRLTATECEWAFARLHERAQRQPLAIKTTEAPHYRRYALQRAKSRADIDPRQRSWASLGVNDGKGIVFVSHTGQIFPSGFLPIECGRFPIDSVVDVYQRCELFRRLRDPDALGGKCGACEFRQVCGGSRARAFAVAGDPLAAEPDCLHVPPRWARKQQVECSA